MTTLSNQLKIQGFVVVQVKDAVTGKVLSHIEKPNLICKGSRIAMTRLVAQRPGLDEPTNERIWGIYVGDDATVPSGSQTWLLGSHITKKAVTQPVSIVPPDDSGIIEVEVEFGIGDHLNQYIREVGLFTRGDNDDPTLATESVVRMLARQTHGEIYKTSAITITYTWRYQFTT